MLEVNPERLLVVGQYVEKAESDLITAAHLLRLRKNLPTDAVCFHAQQCVEKYLKALLVLNEIVFGRTHHISELMALLPAGIRPSLTPDEQDRLTEYAVITRYPGDYDPISREEARQAVQIARRVRRQVRRRLPVQLP
jgi:HEPN domain-containing protein